MADASERDAGGAQRRQQPLEVVYVFARGLCRQQRLHGREAGLAVVESVSAEPFGDFSERFASAAAAGEYDLVWLSHVFFDSGHVVPDLAAIAAAVTDGRTYVVFDGYHAYNALPVDLGPVAERCFYLSGAYKYVMAGEGACFLHCPPGYGERPVVTGWFAGFGSLARDGAGSVGYGEGGTRFLGSTFDPVSIYRLDAALGALDEAGLDPATIHGHVGSLQRQFLAALPEEGPGPLTLSRLVPGIEAPDRGHFLTFRTDSAGAARARLKRGEEPRPASRPEDHHPIGREADVEARLCHVSRSRQLCVRTAAAAAAAAAELEQTRARGPCRGVGCRV